MVARSALLIVLALSVILTNKEVSSWFVTQKINRALTNFGENVNIGIAVADADTGKIIYEKNADRYFHPASNQKLFTAWTALNTLDTNFVFQTQLFADTEKISGGRLRDNVYFKFSGDPTLTYAQVKNLVNALTQAGIKQIVGNVVIDDTSFDEIPMSPGTTWDDKDYCYGSPVSALTIDKNCVNATLTPANKPSEVTILTLPVQPQFMRFVNQATTGFTANPQCKLAITPIDNTGYTISGCIPSTEQPSKISMAISDPRANVRAMLKYLLQQKHIHVSGNFQFQKVASGTQVLAVESSQPLATLLSIMLKESDNTIADALFKTIGKQESGQAGSWKNGSEAMRDVLIKTLQLDIPANTLIDGAGGSRYIYHTPKQIMTLLRQAYISPQSAQFISALAVSGVDGTLKDRLKEPEAITKIQAKTGTMSGVTTLSGFLETRKKHKLIFSIMINGFIDSPDKYKMLEDSLCMVLIENA